MHLHRIEGRYAEAKRRARAQIAAAGGDPSDEAAFLAIERVLEEVFVYVRPNAARCKLAALRTVIADVESDGLFRDAAMACGWAGDVTCARDYIGRSSNRGALQPWSGPLIRYAAAGLARAEGLARALRILREMRVVNCHGCALPFAGPLFEEMNLPDSAAVAYKFQGRVAAAQERLGRLSPDR